MIHPNATGATTPITVIEKKLAATPFRRFERPTRSSVKALTQEYLVAPIIPIMKANRRTWTTDILPVCTRKPISKAHVISATRVASKRSRRPYLSTRTPAIGLNSVRPRPEAPADIPTQSGESVSMSTSQPTAIGVTILPASLKRLLTQNSLNL
jgi:hypothetical protein